jgi:hypothetical protein
MHAGEESDNGVVAMKQPNNNGRPRGGQPEAEAVEPSPLAEENAAQPNVGRTQSRETTSSGLSRVRQAAREGKQQRFTALLHHLSVDLLRESYNLGIILNQVLPIENLLTYSDPQIT